MKCQAPQQLALDFPEYRPEEIKRRNQAAIDKAIREQYPMTPEERAWLPPGVRLARFMPLAECEECNFACEDHTLGCRFASKICVKDLRAKEVNHV